MSGAYALYQSQFVLICLIFKFTSLDSYAAFAVTDFDPNEYAKSVLAGPSTTSSSTGAQQTSVEPAKEDISVAIAKLTHSIDDVSKEIKSVVCHYFCFLCIASRLLIYLYFVIFNPTG